MKGDPNRGGDESTAAVVNGGRCASAAVQRRKKPARHRRERRQRQQARLLLAAVHAAERLVGHHSWPRRRTGAAPPTGAEEARPTDASPRTGEGLAGLDADGTAGALPRPADEPACLHVVQLLGSESRSLETEPLQTQAEQEDLLLHELPKATTDVSYTGVTSPTN